MKKMFRIGSTVRYGIFGENFIGEVLARDLLTNKYFVKFTNTSLWVLGDYLNLVEEDKESLKRQLNLQVEANKVLINKVKELARVIDTNRELKNRIRQLEEQLRAQRELEEDEEYDMEEFIKKEIDLATKLMSKLFGEGNQWE